MKWIKTTSLAFSLFLLASCGEEEPNTNSLVLPSNLVVDVELSNDVNGRVNVSVSADNANYYSIIFRDANGDVTDQNNDGEFSHLFTQSGTYAIISRAHATGADYSEQIDSVTIDFGSGASAGIPDTGYITPLSYPGYNLVWQDEFDGNSLSSDWRHEIGNGANGWGNQELQYYQPSNTEVRDGYLVINTRREFVQGYAYTSSRIITQGRKSFQYGRIDIRAAMPQGQGFWPALWMLGDDISTVGWPYCGEIDIMEMVGGNPRPNGGDNLVVGTAHWDNNGTKADFGASTRKTNGKLADEFHVYSIIWDSQSIKWLFDDVQYHEIDITPPALSEFHQKHFFIFNVAVGGLWPGSPDGTTQFPQLMGVDYVRVFQK